MRFGLILFFLLSACSEVVEQSELDVTKKDTDALSLVNDSLRKGYMSEAEEFGRQFSQGEQSARYARLLERWEKLADRQDKFLDAQEKKYN